MTDHSSWLENRKSSTLKSGVRFSAPSNPTTPTMPGSPLGCTDLLFSAKPEQAVAEAIHGNTPDLRKLLDCLPDGVALADSSGRIVEWNAGMERLFGLARSEVLNRSYDEIARHYAAPAQALPVKSTQRQFIGGSPSAWDGSVVKVRIKRTDGSERLMQHQVFSIPTRDEVLTGILARDITVNVATEHELRKTKEELEHRVEERTAALSQAILTLQQEIAARRQVEESLTYRLKVEKIVSRISNRFLSVTPEALEDEIRFALQTIGEFISADLGYVFMFDKEGVPSARVYEWAKTPSDIILLDTEYVSLEPFGWARQQIKVNTQIQYSTIDDLPPEAVAEREFFSSYGIQSFVAVAIFADDNLFGALGFATRQSVKIWAEEDVLLFRMVAEILGKVLHHHQAEHALEAIKIRQTAMLSLLPAAVYICYQTPAGRIVTWVSSNIERLTGFSASQFREGTGLWRSRIHPDDQARVADTFCHDMGGPISLEYRWQCADGTYRWILDQAIMKSASEPNQLVGVWLDITARHESEQAEHEQRILAEALRDTAELLNNTLATNQIVQALLGSVERVVQCDGCNIMLIEDNLLRVVAARGYEALGETNLLGASFDVEKFFGLQQNVMNGLPHLVADTEADANWCFTLETHWIRSYIGLPLQVQGQTMGCLNVDSATPDYFNETHVARLKALTAQASVALTNAQLYAETNHKAERLRALSQRLVEAQEIERARIARDLHDGIGQILTALMVDLHYFERQSQKPDLLLARVSDSKKTVNNGLADLRKMLSDLRPTMLGYLGLVNALQQYVDNFRRQFEISAELETVGLNDVHFSDDMEIALYRIVQEALTNVARHAQAKHAEVLLTHVDDSLKVMIWDDGIGFDSSAPILGQHMGLLGMRERVEMFGGTFTVESGPGDGTTILVEVPYVDSNFAR
ncbi:MAG: PAS domain S-box protein [Chloroflexi bacterium]|nr:PAS domain S-box protein [Chloroflexota bacterium]